MSISARSRLVSFLLKIILVSTKIAGTTQLKLKALILKTFLWNDFLDTHYFCGDIISKYSIFAGLCSFFK